MGSRSAQSPLMCVSPRPADEDGPAYQGPDSDFSDQSYRPDLTVETGDLINTCTVHCCVHCVLCTVVENYKVNEQKTMAVTCWRSEEYIYHISVAYTTSLKLSWQSPALSIK